MQVQLPKVPQREAILRLTLRRYAGEVGPKLLDSDLLSSIAADQPQQQQQQPGASSSSGQQAASSSSGGASGSGQNGQNGGAPGALRWLAEQTEGFSGSDLVQLCSQAAAVPIQEKIE